MAEVGAEHGGINRESAVDVEHFVPIEPFHGFIKFIGIIGVEFIKRFQKDYFENKRFLWGIIIASIPTALIGLTFEKYAMQYFETITFVFPFPVLVELFPLWVELEVPLLEPFVPELPFALVFPVLLLFVFPVLPAPALLALLALLVLFGTEFSGVGLLFALLLLVPDEFESPLFELLFSLFESEF